MSKILVVGPAWVGDMVMAQVLFKCLKKRAPDTTINVIAPLWTHPLLARMPEVHTALPLPIDHGELALIKRWQIGRQLQTHAYTQGIVLPNSWKAALIPFFAGIPIRTGWLGEMRYGLLNDYRRLNKNKLPLMMQRFAALADHDGSPLPKPQLMANQQKSDKPILVLCPGAEFGESKRWPARYFAVVANHYLAKNWQVLILGSSKDKAFGVQINQLTGTQCRDECGNTTLTKAIDLLASATLVITNDSGLMHIAAALNKPLIALYGSTSPAFTPPLTDKAKILQLSLDCQPCFKRQCPLHHHHCMQRLSPAMVLAASTACGF